MLIRFASLLVIALIAGCAANKPAIQDSAQLGPDGQPVAQPLPDGFEDQYRNGLSLMEDKEFDQAQQHWADMSVIFGQYPGVWTNLGLARFYVGDFEGAVAAYEQVESIDPTFCPVHAVSGVAYRELGQFDDAQASYYAAIDCNPTEGRHYFNLGILLDLYRNDLVGALENYRKARRLMPDNEKLNIWVVDLARRTGADEADPAELDAWEASLRAKPPEIDAVTPVEEGVGINSTAISTDAINTEQGAGAEDSVQGETSVTANDESEEDVVEQDVVEQDVPGDAEGGQ
ncbi:hypothetical protein [Thalassolituus sp.]|uniref:hypothetical protein n=1 Tax=Thalassolituus sp. TaxID=2030822 RepID=UPI0035196CC5